MGSGISVLFYKIEIILLVLFSGYIIYYGSSRFWRIYNFTKTLFKKNKYAKTIITERKNKTQNINKTQLKRELQELNEMDKKKIKGILKQIHLNKARGEYDIAKNMIIEALLIDKFNKKINMELASLYIIDGDFEKAELIYKDLLLVHNDDFDVLKKLGFVLSHQEKFDLAIEIYRKAYDINKSDLEIINMLANLYYYKGDYINSEFYLKKYLKNKPRNSDNLMLLATCYKKMSNIKSAINTLKKLLEFEPYNEQAKNLLEKLENPEAEKIINNN